MVFTKIINYAPLAQLAEHLTLNQQVPGSSPGGRTNNLDHISGWFSPALKGSILRMSLERDAVARLVMCKWEYIR